MKARLLLVVAVGLVAGACGSPLPVVDAGGDYDPLADPLVDPPSLYELYPVAEPERAESGTTIVRHDFSQPATLNPLFPSGAASAWTMFGMLFEWLVVRHGSPALGGEYDQIYVDANIFARQATGELFEARGVKGRHASALLLSIVWNMDGSNPFFGDPLVRRALAHAYDADTVLRRVGHGLYRRSYGYMVEERWDYEPAILGQAIDHDLTRAGELLDQAGWLADPDTGWRYREVGGERVRFSFELSYTAGLTYVPPTLDILREDFRRLGVEMVTRAYESATLNEKRTAIYREIHREVYRDQPALFLFHVSFLWVFNNDIRGVELGPMGTILLWPTPPEGWPSRTGPGWWRERQAGG